MHVGVIFHAITPSSELSEDAKIFQFTEFKYDDNNRHVGSEPRPGDNSGLIDILSSKR